MGISGVRKRDADTPRPMVMLPMRLRKRQGLDPSVAEDGIIVIIA